MSEETLPKGQTVEVPKEAQADAQPAAPQPQSISVQEILNTYPIDRDKCRDVVLLEISGNMKRIADSLDAISQGLIVANTHLSEANSLKKMGK